MLIVVIGLACLAVLGGVVLLAVGRGGELSRPQPDAATVSGPPSADGVPRLHRTLWGYHPDETAQTLASYARALDDRDRVITDLRARLASAQDAASAADTDAEPEAGTSAALDPSDPASEREARELESSPATSPRTRDDG